MDADTGTYYSVLEVNESASAEELKTAYHGLAREYHPDTLPPELRERRVGKDAEANFKLISEAYKVLSDPEQRALYDEQLQALRAGEAPSAEANPPCPPPAEAEPACPPPAAARRSTSAGPKPRRTSLKAPRRPLKPSPSPHRTATLLRISLLLAAVISAFILFSRGAKAQRPENKKTEAKTAFKKAGAPDRGEEVKRILKLFGSKLVKRVEPETVALPAARNGAEAQPGDKIPPWEKTQRPALIPAGEFLMDTLSDKGEPAGLPQKAYVEAFYIDRTEVTAGRYKAFAAATGREMMKQLPEWNTAAHPVVDVEWEDAAAYCQWAGGRLPTEEEWEKAAHGGADTEHRLGDDESVLGGYAWHEGNSNNQAHPVRQKRPNQYGLYDMYGNVREWVAGGGARQYTRGGGWSSSPSDLLRRNWHFPGYRNHDLGFRCVVPVDTRKHRI